ncbi:MAG: sigma-70 family RNA polymerase sigma factor [Clostridia bacterium]|nr:sigma-70 family RNA polymerase sigma factor [Clostridia bacterium]
MKKIIYQFVDGTRKEVEVSDEFYAEYQKLEKEEQNKNRAESRRHISLSQLQDNHFEPILQEPSPEEILIKEEQIAVLHKAMSSLTEKQLKVFVLYAEQGLSFTEIGEKLGISKDTVKEHYWSAIKKLQRFF